MSEEDPLNQREQTTASAQIFMVHKDTIGICIILARKMSETGKGNFRIIAPEDNDIDPSTGYLYPDDKVRMLKVGQGDFSAYDKALEEVLSVWQLALDAFDQDFATMAAFEEINKQTDYFRFGIN